MKKILILIMLVIGINSIKSQPLTVLGHSRKDVLEWFNDNPDYGLLVSEPDVFDSLKFTAYSFKRSTAVITAVGFKYENCMIVMSMMSKKLLKPYLKKLTDDKDIVKVKKHTWMSKTKGYGFELVIPNNKRGVYGVMFYLLEDETFN